MRNSSLNNSITVVNLIESRQHDLVLSDLHIAEALGCNNPAMTGLIKRGVMRIPVLKVPHLAEVLRVKPSVLMRMVLFESSPEMLQAIEACYGSMEIAANEDGLPQFIHQSKTGGDSSIVMCDAEVVFASHMA